MPSRRPTPPSAASESEFLKAYDPSAFERPSVAVDVVLLTLKNDRLHTLVIRRPEHPFAGRWQLPGAFIRMEETLEQTAARALRDKTGLKQVFVEQLYTFGAVKRDPRTRVLSVAYLALVHAERFASVSLPAEDALMAEIRVPWEGTEGGPVDLLDPLGRPLATAFDHRDIVGMAIQRLRGKLDYSALGFQLLPPSFTLFQLQRLHEVVLGHGVNKDSFRRRMLATGQLEATGEMQEAVGHRPAALYRFVRESAV